MWENVFFSSFTPTLTPSASLCSSLGGTQWRNTSTTTGSWRWWGRWVKMEKCIFVRHCLCLCMKSPCTNHVNVGHKGPDCVPQHHLQGEGKLGLSQQSMVEKYRFTTTQVGCAPCLLYEARCCANPRPRTNCVTKCQSCSRRRCCC